MTRHFILPRYILATMALGGVACGRSDLTGFHVVTSGDTVTMSGGAGVLIHRDSLAGVDDGQLPCCALDSAGVHIQVTAGTMMFYAASSYSDIGNTPAGPRPVACVQGVPNGAFIARNNLVTLLDGESYLLMPCTAGYYALTLTERLDYLDGSSATRQVTLSAGRYGWQRDLLSLTEQQTVGHAGASLSRDTITVAVPGHRYLFVALPR